MRTLGERRSQKKEDYGARILLGGASGTGKTALIRLLCGLPFEENLLPTLGIQIHPYKLPEGKNVFFFDLGGSRLLQTVRKLFFRSFFQSSALILIYNIVDYSSFLEITDWVDEVIDYSTLEDNFPLLLIGNKTDLQAERQVEYEEGETLAKELGATFIELSMKDMNKKNHIRSLNIWLEQVVSKTGIPECFRNARENWFKKRYKSRTELSYILQRLKIPHNYTTLDFVLSIGPLNVRVHRDNSIYIKMATCDKCHRTCRYKNIEHRICIEDSSITWTNISTLRKPEIQSLARLYLFWEGVKGKPIPASIHSQMKRIYKQCPSWKNIKFKVNFNE
ncbi:MAG: Rab family GTPase [Candidatus Hermodarchaeota archaeon]